MHTLNPVIEWGVSTRCFGDSAIRADQLEALRRAGFERIEIHAGGTNIDFRDKAWVRSLAQWFRDHELPPSSLHLPFEEPAGPGRKRPLSVIESEWRARAHALDEIKRSLELAERIRVDYAVLHLGAPGDRFTPTAFDHAYAAIQKIFAFAGVRVLVENLPNDIARLDRIREFKSVADLPDLGVCYDTGHARLEGVVALDAGTGIGAMHIDDNDGTEDAHAPPFDGTLNWTVFVEQLVTSKFRGPLILELSAGLSDGRPEIIGAAAERRRRLQDLFDEAAYSIEEFRLKYRLPASRSKEEE